MSKRTKKSNRMKAIWTTTQTRSKSLKETRRYERRFDPKPHLISINDSVYLKRISGQIIQYQNIIYSLKVSMQHQERDNFDNLLEDISTIDHHHSITFDKLNLTEKQRTREETYEETMKKINQAKIEQTTLRKQLQLLKQETCHNYLYRFQEELEELNHENLALRKELHQSNLKKKQDKSERLSNRSSIKVRSSFNSVIGDENKRTHTKANRNNGSPNMVLKKKEIKLAESTTFLGRSQVTSPVNHKRRESQLTERKADQKHCATVSDNCSFMDDKYSECNFKQSVSRQSFKCQPQQKNVFVQILEKMLKEQVALDNDKYAEMYLESTREPEQVKDQIVHINVLEKDIKETNDKLQMLNLVVNRYQSQIQGMNVNIKTVTDLTQKLYEVKGRYVEMEKKCEKLGHLRKKVTQKEQMLKEKTQEQERSKDEVKTIASVETLIKIMTNNTNKTFPCQTSQLYATYYLELKQLFKFDKEDQVRRSQKMVKVKEMIDGIRQSRKKFNELIQIYEGRIKKLQDKIGRVRQQQQSHSAKSRK